MTVPFFTVVVVTILLGLVGATAANFFQAKRGFYIGLAVWGRWLPVAATGLYLAVLAVNLAPGGPGRGHALNLSGMFSTTEIIALFLVGPLFLTRVGNVLAAAIVAYGIERLIDSSAPGPSAGLLFVSGAATVVAVLGDKMPWLAAERQQVVAQKLREIILVSLTVGALGVIATAMFRVHAVSSWVNALYGSAIPDMMVFAALTVLLVGWLSIAMGFTRHLTLPVLAVPTLLILAYVTTWPTSLLIVPFTLCLSLSLAAGDRRLQGRRFAA